ncbi:MAG: hypothetical protein NZ585_10015 [Chloracidobacterium sp.]|nr:hypothetical protein [Chloracidobacterium sp.]MDW8216756.1 hypothetical protein [Acidobacteriota bacterium]
MNLRRYRQLVGLVLSLLFGCSLRLSAAGAPQGESFRYEFEQPNFLVTRMTVVLDAAGRGTLEYVEKDALEPTRAPVALRPESLARLQQLAVKVAALRPEPPSEKHANLGLSKLTLVVDGKPVSVTFTYTRQPAVLELGRFFRGLVTQHQRVSQIETARRYQPLDMPKLLSALEADLNAQRLAEPAALSDLLASLANDLRLSLIARNQARRLYARVNGK